MWAVQNQVDATTGSEISRRLEYFKKVNYFLLSLLLFQATSFTQKMINSASKTTDTHKSQYA